MSFNPLYFDSHFDITPMVAGSTGTSSTSMMGAITGLLAPVPVGIPVIGIIEQPLPLLKRVRLIKPRIPLKFWKLVAAFLKSKINQ